MYRVLM
ncbi:hypothetical protein F383_39460 [Gossypium arboreum]|nr:hypothetical protein F383_39460 [Gossypium arboreum]